MCAEMTYYGKTELGYLGKDNKIYKTEAEADNAAVAPTPTKVGKYSKVKQIVRKTAKIAGQVAKPVGKFALKTGESVVEHATAGFERIYDPQETAMIKGGVCPSCGQKMAKKKCDGCGEDYNRIKVAQHFYTEGYANPYDRAESTFTPTRYLGNYRFVD
jgi:hypothetical protein